MNLTTPLLEIIDHTRQTLQSRRLQREQKARALSVMMATRTLRPADVYVRSLPPAKHLPGLLITKPRSKPRPQQPSCTHTDQHAEPQLELNWHTPVGDILAYLRHRLITA